MQFLRERALPEGGPGAAADVIDVNDMPVSFAHTDGPMPAAVSTAPLSRCTALWQDRRRPPTRLIDYAHGEEHA
ncbi:Type I-E CRISPR-associated protein Cas5/CasD OS=Streptomyces microflavus OX=1919 GN=Smic_09520 PE=4 SV=1 [Streptomyces microflavus]